MRLKIYLSLAFLAVSTALPLQAQNKPATVNTQFGQRMAGTQPTQTLPGQIRPYATTPTVEELLGCPDGTVFGGEYVEQEGIFTGQSSADMGRTDMATKFYQQFSDCYYKFSGVRFVGLFKYWDEEEYNWFACNDRGDIDENGEMHSPIRFEICFFKMGADGMPGEQIYKKEFDLTGEFTGIQTGDELSGYSNVYSFTADLGQELSLESGYMSVTAVDMGDKPSCWFSVFTTSTSTGAGYTYAEDMGFIGQNPMIFCFKGDGTMAAAHALKLERMLSPVSSKEGKYAKVQVEYSNIGSQSVENVTLELWADGELKATETIPGTIPSFGTYKYTFDARVDLTGEGEHVITVKNVTPGDEKLADDAISATITTMKDGEYAESKSTDCTLNYTTQVTLGSINSTSDATNYSDFTAQKTEIKPGDKLTLDIKEEGMGYIRAWIDWNGNGTFEDATEEVFINYVNNDYNHYAGEVSIPAGAGTTPGDKRLRIVNSYYTPESAGVYDYGETEDYTVTVVPRPGMPVVEIGADNIDKVADSGTSTAALEIANGGDGELKTNVTYSYVLPKSPTASYAADVADNAVSAKAKAQMKANIKVNRMHSPMRTAPKADAQTQYVLGYDLTQYDVIGITNSDNVIYAAYYPGAMLESLDGMKISSVDVFIGDVPGKASIVVYGQGDQNHPGSVIAEKEIQPAGHSWNRVALDTPLDITGQDVWVGVKMSGFDSGSYNIGVDNGPAVIGYGDLVNIGGDTWWSMADLGLSYNYNIRANVTGTPSPAISWMSVDKTEMNVPAGGKETLNITLDATNLGKQLYEGYVKIESNDELSPAVKIPVYLVSGTGSGIHDIPEVGASLRIDGGVMTISSEKTIARITVADAGGSLLTAKDINANEATVSLPAGGSRVVIVTVAYTDGTRYVVKLPAMM